MLGERLHEGEVVGVATIPSANRAAGEREVRVMDDARGVEELLHTQSRTRRAGAGRIVEGEQAGLELGNAVAANATCEAIREHQLFLLGVVHEGNFGSA